MEINTEEKLSEKPLKIRGIAIKVTKSRNGNVYVEDELKKAVETLKGKPVYIEHVNVNNAIGKVVNAWWDDKIKGIFYEAEIYDEEVKKKIMLGLIKHVSIGADYEILDVSSKGEIPRGLRFRELSLVAVPGIPETNIEVLEKLEAKILESVKKDSLKIPEQKKEFAKTEERMGKEEKEKWIKKLKDRSRKYGIKFFEDLVDWKWREIPEEKLGDPVNLHLPVHDSEHAKAGASLGAKYLRTLSSRDEESARKVWSRLKRLLKKYGLEIHYDHRGKPLEEKHEPPSGGDGSSNPRSGAVSEKEEEKVSESEMEKGIVENKEGKVEERYGKIVKELKETLSVTSGAIATRWVTPIEVEPVGIIGGLRRFVKTVTVPEGAEKVRILKMTVPEFGALTEGTEPSEATWSIDYVEVPVSEYGVAGRFSYSKIEDIGEELIREVEQALVKSAVRKEDAEILASLDADTGVQEIFSAGTKVDDITADDTFTADLILEALKKIKEQGFDINPADMVLVLHPKQWEDLNKSLGWYKDASKSYEKGGFVEAFFGIPIVISDKVKSAQNAGSVTYYQAYLFRKDAVAFAVKRELLVESQKEIGKRALLLVASHRFGVKPVFPKAIVRIYSA